MGSLNGDFNHRDSTVLVQATSRMKLDPVIEQEFDVYPHVEEQTVRPAPADWFRPHSPTPSVVPVSHDEIKAKVRDCLSLQKRQWREWGTGPMKTSPFWTWILSGLEDDLPLSTKLQIAVAIAASALRIGLQLLSPSPPLEFARPEQGRSGQEIFDELTRPTFGAARTKTERLDILFASIEDAIMPLAIPIAILSEAIMKDEKTASYSRELCAAIEMPDSPCNLYFFRPWAVESLFPTRSGSHQIYPAQMQEFDSILNRLAPSRSAGPFETKFATPISIRTPRLRAKIVQLRPLITRRDSVTDAIESV
jgi:hypothetical protein